MIFIFLTLFYLWEILPSFLPSPQAAMSSSNRLPCEAHSELLNTFEDLLLVDEESSQALLIHF